MSPARTIFAVLLGYLALLVLEVIGGIAAGAIVHARTGAGVLIAGEIVVLVSAIAAGAITARTARERPLAHAGALGLSILSVTAVLAAVSPRSAHATVPVWYPYAIALFGGVGAFIGGALASGSTREA